MVIISITTITTITTIITVILIIVTTTTNVTLVIIVTEAAVAIDETKAIVITLFYNNTLDASNSHSSQSYTQNQLSLSSIPISPSPHTSHTFHTLPLQQTVPPPMAIQVNEESILAALSAMQRNDTQSIQEAGSFLLSAMQDAKNLEIFFSILCQPYPPHVLDWRLLSFS